MKEYPLIGASIIAVIILVLSSLTNVVGYQKVILSNENVINGEVERNELLFQTIVDIANNEEIQRIIIKSQIIRGKFFDSDVKFSVFNTPVLTKNHLKYMYFVGMLFSKTFNKSKIHSMVKQYQLSIQGIQKEIAAVIEKDARLNGEIRQLSNSECDCENKNTTVWHFPVICIALYFLTWFFVVLWLFGISIAEEIGNIILHIGYDINCFFPPFP